MEKSLADKNCDSMYDMLLKCFKKSLSGSDIKKALHELYDFGFMLGQQFNECSAANQVSLETGEASKRNFYEEFPGHPQRTVPQTNGAMELLVKTDKFLKGRNIPPSKKWKYNGPDVNKESKGYPFDYSYNSNSISEEIKTGNLTFRSALYRLYFIGWCDGIDSTYVDHGAAFKKKINETMSKLKPETIQRVRDIWNKTNKIN